MEKSKIIISKEVVDDLNQLVKTLFYEDYFTFESSAQMYVSHIYDFLEFDLISFPHKSTPKNLKKLGSYYAFYKPNSSTTWFVFFEKYESEIFIKYLTNNHNGEINHLNV
ncbi:MAG: hypothetical protein ACOVLC_00975 [Flavobacterium sp.]